MSRRGSIFSARRGINALRFSRPDITYLANWNDLTFTRASEAAYTDPRNGWAFRNDTATAALDWTGDDANLYDPEAPTWTAFSGAPTITSGQTDPNGGTAAWRIEDANAGGYVQAQADGPVTHTGGNAVRVGLWVKVDDDTVFPEVQLYRDAVATALVQFNPQTGATNVRAGSATQIRAHKWGDWWHVSWATASVAAGDLRIRLNPAIGLTSGFPSLSTSATGFCDVYGPSIVDEGAASAGDVPNIYPWLAADEPRIFTDGAILIEGARTNLVTYSADLTQFSAAGGGAATVTQPDGAAPDGSSAGTLTDAIATLQGNERYSAILTTANPATASVYVEKVAGNEAAIESNADRTTATVGVGGGFERIAITRASAGNKRVELINADNGSAGSFDTEEENRWWGMQMEDAAFASSPIRTAGATATRSLDDFDTADGSTVFSDAFFSEGFEIDVWPLFDVADAANRLVFGNNAGYSYIRFNTSGGIHYRAGTAASQGTEKASAALTYSAGDKVTLRVEHGVSVKVYVNGALQTTLDISSGAGPGWDAAQTANPGWQVGNYSGGQALFGVLSRPRAL